MDGIMPDKPTLVLGTESDPVGSKLLKRLIDEGYHVSPLEEVVLTGGLTQGMAPRTIIGLGYLGRGLTMPQLLVPEEVYVPKQGGSCSKIKKGPGKGNWRAYRFRLN